jgi:hypothetical protein
MTSMNRNPVFWLMWILPGAAVLAGFATLAIALRHGDRPLPDFYHWEGERLDADFARARVAAQLGLHAALQLSGGVCTVTLSGDAGDSRALNLQLTNAGDANLDLRLSLQRVAIGTYRAPCAALPRGRWRLALQDDANTWSMRASFDGVPERLALQARDPAGQGA